jgi:peptide methionine sulfoxide reductase msrA/msrB
VLYDPSKINYESVVKYFFEIHDPTQTDGQGPDIGEQYLSAIFYYDQSQEVIAKTVIHQLILKNYAIATKVLPVRVFFKAEEYHQDYYSKTGKTPYCHQYVKRF